MSGAPAFALSARLDILTANRLSYALFTPVGCTSGRCPCPGGADAGRRLGARCA